MLEAIGSYGEKSAIGDTDRNGATSRNIALAAQRGGEHYQRAAADPHTGKRRRR